MSLGKEILQAEVFLGVILGIMFLPGDDAAIQMNTFVDTMIGDQQMWK